MQRLEDDSGRQTDLALAYVLCLPTTSVLDFRVKDGIWNMEYLG